MLKTSDGLVSATTIPRDNLQSTQTPQTFFLQEIVEVHKEALKRGITNSIASCTLYIEMGKPVYMSIGSEKNLKLTTSEDIEIFMALLHAKRPDWLRQ
jgi:2-C-methyl-D-erythritol 4-phosphate cytidylyltransferase